ncbi:hypothetical protein [Streptosporangium subroseum]|uniref:hypothetical protein n=1 Tax=Streptosporangium subroseum TaxID=106412 RepID=UPI00308E4354|nr:hypothetical protein OHB15_22255 [Streptosporangium subroseum]
MAKVVDDLAERLDIGDASMPKPYGEVVRHHIGVLGRCSVRLPHPPGSPRPLRDKDATDGA